MNNELKLALVQANLVWESKKQNLQHLRQLVLDNLGADVYILPEMFSTGFSMNAQALGEEETGPTVVWMHDLAKESQAVIVGSLIIKESGNYYNRLFWVQPDGKMHTYNKRHLFTLANEEKTYTAGTKKVIISYKGWRILPLVCYDLRFPVWSRNVDSAYDLLIYVANWPERRASHWQKLLPARAIENLSYVVGVNRVGEDGKQINHSGNSVVINPLGEQIAKLAEAEEGVILQTIYLHEVQETRQKFNFLNDADSFTVHL